MFSVSRKFHSYTENSNQIINIIFNCFEYYLKIYRKDLEKQEDLRDCFVLIAVTQLWNVAL